MKWIKIFSVWLCIIPVAILNGGFREYFLENYLSEKASLSVSGIILSVLIFFYYLGTIAAYKRNFI